MKDKYEFGKCYICLKETALKNGLCPECKSIDEGDFPEIWDNLFNSTNKNE